MKFAKSHEWIEVKDGVATIGISDHAQDSLGDITFVELPSVGSEFTKNNIFGVIESVKAASDVYMPVSGKIVEVNEELEMTPELVNQSPIDDGWLLKIELTNESELDELMTEDEYKTFLENE
jgi:glycine cleavage system H protein